MEIKLGDILEYFSSNVRTNQERLILVHGCNAKGVMNSGIARQIRLQYPDVFHDYITFLGKPVKHNILGNIAITHINSNSVILSAIIQPDYGRDNRIRYVEYDAVRDAFLRVVSFNRVYKGTIIFPKIGAGLGNGDWDVIKRIIEETIPSDMRSILFIMP